MSGQIGPLLIAESVSNNNKITAFPNITKQYKANDFQVEAHFRGLLMCMFEFVICIGTLYM